MTWNGRGRGFLADRATHRPRRFMLNARHMADPAPKSYSLRQHLPEVFDQGPTGSCTAHAKITCLITAGNAQGLPLPFTPSPRDLYRLTLCSDRTRGPDGKLPPLADIGAEPAQVEKAVREWGVTPIGPLVDDRYSDCTPDNIVQEPDLQTILDAAKSVYTGDYAIAGVGEALLANVKKAIHLGYPVSVGFFADTQFDRFTLSSPPLETQNFADPDGGWHYAMLYGYDGDLLYGRNSWGLDYGDLGDFRAGPAWLRQCVGLYAHQITGVAA